MTELFDSNSKQLTPEALAFELSDAEKQIMVDMTKMARSFSGPARSTLVKASAMLSSAVHMSQMQAMALMVVCQKFGPKDIGAAEVPAPMQETVMEAIRAKPALEDNIESATVPIGLSPLQESKYTTDGTHLVNRASGERIPLDEPVFVMRAKDPLAALVISLYIDMISPKNEEHRQALIRVFNRFMHFRAVNARRMAAEPTTDLSTTSNKE